MARIVYYHYDDWGNLLSIVTATEGNATQLAVAKANPLRYRGSYYDAETGYYYLQSRYYDASICRFINADVPEFLGIGESVAKWNLFSYCENDAVNRNDMFGNASLKNKFRNLGKAIKWGPGLKVTVTMSYKTTITFAFLALLLRVLFVKNDIKGITSAVKGKLTRAIVIALPIMYSRHLS